MKKDLTDANIDLYKWIKIIEYIILIVLGLILAITGAIFKEVNEDMSYPLGVVLAVFSTMNIISGYLLYRSPFNQDIGIGILGIGFSVVLFCLPNILTKIISIFLITVIFCAALMLIINGIDHLGVFKDSVKKVKVSVFEFILSAVLFGLAGVYLYFFISQKMDVDRFIIVIIGALLVIFGIFCIVSLLKKVKNTKEALFEQEINKEPTYNTSSEIINQDVKVVDLADLKKENRRKGKNHQKATHVIEDTREVKAISDSKEDDNDNKSDDKKN